MELGQFELGGETPLDLLVVEDHPIVLAGYRQLFQGHASVLIEAKSIAEAHCHLITQKPDVMLMNANLPDGSGLAFLRRLKREKLHTRIVVFAVMSDVRLAMQAIDYGAKGVVTKSEGLEDIVAAVQAAARGEIWMSNDLIRQIALGRINGSTRMTPGRVMSALKTTRFTRREKNILGLLILGADVTEIASELNISPMLVSSDAEALCRKLNARTVDEMVVIAVESNLQNIVGSTHLLRPKRGPKRFAAAQTA
ncbi:MAG: response regulator transcription factor [Proteobacteria bacterium]|nr:response regulator transcription factor [Pseudomonadota bacterium]